MSVDLMNVVGELAPTLMKYSEINPKYIKIKIEKFDNGCQIKIISDKPEVCDALTELLLMMAKISEANEETKVTVDVV